MPAIAFFLMLFSISFACGAEGIDCPPQFIDAGQYSRNTPNVYVDQAMESLPNLHPGFVLMVLKREGRVGDIDYSLLAYKESPSTNMVTIEGLASYEQNKTWMFSLLVDSNKTAEAMLCILEHVSALPSNSRFKRDATQKCVAP
jgi:hypothetical protein